MTPSPIESFTPSLPGPGLLRAKRQAPIIATLGRLVLPASLLCLGVRKLLTQSFIPGWQPVSPGANHPALAIADAVLLMALSGMAIAGPRRDLALLGLGGLLASWILVIQGPGLEAAPRLAVLWLGVAEVGAVAAASLLLAVDLSASGDRWPNSRRIGFVAFGLCCLVFGASHFIYADFTSKMIPAWIPARVPLAYLTGAAHIAAGLAIASGILRRTAAILLVCMMTGFVILIHAPAVLISQGSLEQVTFLLNACALCGSSLAIARVARDTR